ncbi:hypothetical protein Hanom_Chr04g00361831 [Helianthus anomalus]
MHPCHLQRFRHHFPSRDSSESLPSNLWSSSATLLNTTPLTLHPLKNSSISLAFSIGFLPFSLMKSSMSVRRMPF